MVSPILSSHNPSARPRVVAGLGLVGFGVVLLLDRMEVVDAAAVLRYWPLILIAIGVRQLAAPPDHRLGLRAFRANGVIWIAAGGVLLLNSLGLLRANAWELFWPAVLILVGVRLITWSGGRRPSGDGESADAGPIFAVMSGIKRVSAPVPFAGSEITAFMGGVHLDLRRALLRPGQEAVIDIAAVLGGCELFLPAEWIVSAPLVAIMGGVDDRRIVAPQPVLEATTGESAPRLVLRGIVLMGGVTIRS